MIFQYNDFIQLCDYSIKTQSNRSFWFFPPNINIQQSLKQLKKKNYHNMFIIDCAEYYNDSDIVPMLTAIINKQRNTSVNTSFMKIDTHENTSNKNPNDKNTSNENTSNENTSNKTTIHETFNDNLIFMLNTHTFEESSKNLVHFINTLPSSSENSNFHIFFLFSSYLKNNIKNSMAGVINKTIWSFKNYRSFIKHKNELFPFNKMRITKLKSQEYLSNILYIQSLKTDCINTYSHDYKHIIIDFLTNPSFNYSSIFNISHYENIPLILYENCELIIKNHKNNKNNRNIINEIRQLCINYYSYTNNPDFSLFEKNNLYYFLYNFKKLMNTHTILICKDKLHDISFTTYYSNRASEIQYQKTIDSYSFI